MRRKLVMSNSLISVQNKAVKIGKRHCTSNSDINELFAAIV